MASEITVRELTDILDELRREGFGVTHLAIISALADPAQPTESPRKLQKVLETHYQIPVSIGECSKALRNDKIQAAVAKVFARTKQSLLLAIEQNMMRTAADPDSKEKVQAARLMWQKEGMLDADDRRQNTIDPAAQLVQQLHQAQKDGGIKIDSVTGRVEIRGSMEVSGRMGSQEARPVGSESQDPSEEEEDTIEGVFDEFDDAAEDVGDSEDS